MFQYNDRTIFQRISAGWKILLMMLIVVTVFTITEINYLFYMFLFSLSLLILAKYKDYHKLLFSLAPFLLFFSLLFWYLDLKPNMTEFIIFISLRIITMFFTFAWFTTTTDLFSLLKLMKKIKVPKTIYLTFYLMMRFLPEIEKDYKEIKDLQKIRGIRLRNGLMLYIRQMFIPLIYVLFDRIDELSIALYLREKKGKI